MSVNSLGSYGNNPALWGMDFQNLTENGKKAKSSGTSAPRAAQNPNSAYAGGAYGNSVSGLSSALKSVMNDMGLSSSDRITFQTLMDYRDQSQSQFSEQVKKDLKALGVDENATFRLVSGPDGSGVKVVADDEATQAQIEKYFKDNPEMVKKFEKIQSLNKMDDTRKQEHIDVESIRTRLQLESMSTWYASDSSGFMAFASQGAAYYSGINALA